jgi:hypothetical protein
MELNEFIEKHRYGIDPTSTANYKVLFEYLPFEKKYFKHIQDNRLSIIKKSRQMHVTTMMAAYIAWHLLFNEEAKHQIIYYVSNNASQNRHFVSLVRGLLVTYGVTMDAQPINNKNEMLLDTGNCLKALCASPESFCSLSFKRAHMIVFDEAAFIHQFDEAYTAMFGNYDHTKIVLQSTPNGTEAFHRLYMNAKKGQNSYNTLDILWNENPRYDDEWLEAQKNMLNNDRRFRQEILAEFLTYEPKPKKKSKSNTIQVRLDDKMMSQLGIKLVEEDQSMSDYIRELIAANLN